jgi:hypothetical protein
MGYFPMQTPPQRGRWQFAIQDAVSGGKTTEIAEAVLRESNDPLTAMQGCNRRLKRNRTGH